MPVFKFSSVTDAEYIRRRDAEMYMLYYKPRRWLVNNGSITLNIYGEPGDPVTGTDGVTSIPATRTLTSAAANFTTAGVGIGDILEVAEESPYSGDNGRYIIDQVTSAHVLRVSANWPVGSLTALKWMVHFLNERYTEFAQLIPFLVKLDPPTEELSKWGIEEKRDAIVALSIEVCESLALTPKIGDRFIYEYEDGDVHFEMKEIMLSDQLGDSGVALHWIGGAVKTDIKLP